MAPHASFPSPVAIDTVVHSTGPRQALLRQAPARQAVVRQAVGRRVLGLLLTAATAACGGTDAPSDSDSLSPEESPATVDTPADPGTAEVPLIPVDDPTGLNAPATFRALLPCADCPGILTTLAVEPDGSATLTRRYLEGEPGRDPAFVEEGRWAPDGTQTIAFTAADGGEGERYLVHEGDLVVLARDGSQPTTRSPRLARLPEGGMTELAGTSWRFVDPAPAGGDAAVPSVRFQPDGAVAGSDGCNAFRSTWSTPDERVLAIAAIASTRMACPEGAGVVALRVAEALEATAGYRLEDDGGALVLLDGAGDPIARLRPTP